VTNVLFTVNYNPALLTITDVTGNDFDSLLPSSTPGHAVVQYNGPPLPTGDQPFAYLQATVPSGTAANPVPYKAKDLMTLTNVSLDGGATPVATANAVHLVAYVGDTDGNGAYTSNDAVLITRVVLQTDNGFTAYPLVDPVVVADTDGSGFIPADAALQVNEAGVAFPTANLPVPPIPPGGVFQPISNNVDPSVSVGREAWSVGRDGFVATVPVNIDDAHPTGSTGLIAGRLVLTYDPDAFTISAADVHPGSLLAGGDWSIVPTIDQATGQIAIALSSTAPITSTEGGSLVTIDFHPVGQISNLSSINLVPSASVDGQPVRTELEDAQGAFRLTFATTTSVVTPVADPGTSASDGQPRNNQLATTMSVAGSSANADLEPSPELEIAGPAAAALPEASDPEFVNAPTALSESASLHLAAAAVHGSAAVVASALPTTSLVPLTGLVFQFGTMVGALGNAPAAGPHWSDSLFQALGRTAGSDFSLAATAQILERAFAGQQILSQPVSDFFDSLNWEEGATPTDWQAVAAQSAPSWHDRSAAPRATAHTPPAEAAADHGALDQAFAQTLDDLGLADDE
jgi:hypothetical protein